MNNTRMGREDIVAILNQIDIGDVLYDRWEFRLLEKGDGFLLQLVYYEADGTNPSGPAIPQHARKWYISPYSTETEIVRTAHKAVMCSLEHRLGEHFRYRGAQIYSPHMPVPVLEVFARGDTFDTRKPRT